MQRVIFTTDRVKFEGELNETLTARAIIQALPITSTVQRWGEEVYFMIPLELRQEQPTMEVHVGDLAYWPQGPALCIFFGPTPASNTEAPKPASPVTIIGRTTESLGTLRSIQAGRSITIACE